MTQTTVAYYEASAVVTVPSGPVTLDYFHKLAWRLFDGDGDHRHTQRPFIFRSERIDEDRNLLTLRASEPFSAGVPYTLTVANGLSVCCDLMTVPTRRREKLRYTPSRATWPDLYADLMARNGLTVDAPPLTSVLGYYTDKPAHTHKFPVANSWITGQVTDAAAFARAYCTGVSRRKGYGMGLILLSTQSVLQSQQVA
ncbi:type I-E CRISPR-associated protein Cas6/Cse3/CasE [Salinisphaera orenii]|uniref:type I-E CRISPR-associated protein Cas6/Cse3/CasE n=1 Tax=Salinisphaera orenii TaxID=856731 RepID=UPI0013A61ACE